MTYFAKKIRQALIVLSGCTFDRFGCFWSCRMESILDNIVSQITQEKSWLWSWSAGYQAQREWSAWIYMWEYSVISCAEQFAAWWLGYLFESHWSLNTMQSYAIAISCSLNCLQRVFAQKISTRTSFGLITLTTTMPLYKATWMRGGLRCRYKVF